MHAILNSWAYINVCLISERIIIPLISLMFYNLSICENRKCINMNIKEVNNCKGGCLVSITLTFSLSIEMTLIEIIKLIRVLLICFLAGFSTGKTGYSIIDFLTLTLHVS